MKKYNCIVVFDKEKSHILFCKRTKDPYKGLYNFVGGKVEAGESSDDAAYRELQEETGISRSQIRLFHFMDLTYYYQEMILELYVGQLSTDIKLVAEVNPLEWFTLAEDFDDPEYFAGDQNMAHIINVALKFPLEKYRVQCLSKGLCIGVDGCKGGWIAAILENGKLRIEKYTAINDIVEAHPKVDHFLIDMAIGLPSSELDMRPESKARELLKSRASTIFPIPCRQAVYAGIEDQQKAENIRVLGKSLPKQTLAILPKIRQLDEFLAGHPEYQSIIQESHPEVCFARLYGAVLTLRKSEYPGYSQRIDILSRFLEDVRNVNAWQLAKELKCNPDDIVDAMCLAVTANLQMQAKTTTIPERPQKDANGLTMQMVIPDIF